MDTSKAEISAVSSVENANQKNRQIQFNHVQCYSRSLAKNFKTEKKDKLGNVVKKEGRRWTVSDIAAEADRVENHIPHVTNPMRPVLVMGAPVSELVKLCDEMLVDKKQNGGKAIRKDTPVLLAAVYSIPVASVEYANNKERVDKFISDSLEWHEKTYGPVVSCVLHLDEGYCHTHTYSVSEDARGMVPGYVAKRAEYKKRIDAGESKIEAMKHSHRTYSAAMKEVQNSYYLEVSVKNGLERYGPRRNRYSPGEARMKRVERENEAVALRAALEREDINRKRLATEIIEQERLNKESSANLAEMMVEKKRIDQQVKLIAHEKLRIKQTSHNLTATPEFKKDQELKKRNEEILALKKEVVELKEVIVEKDSYIDKLLSVISDLKYQLKEAAKKLINKIR